MARIAVGLTQPKNQQAAGNANEEFYKKHPDMKGKRIDPCNPKHLKYQKEWMDSYIKNGGAYRRGKYEAQCGQPTQNCPCDGRLTVSIVDPTQKRKGVSGVDVAIWGPSNGRKVSDINGNAAFSGLDAGFYLIEVKLQNSLSYETTAQVLCGRSTSETIDVDPYPLITESFTATGDASDTLLEPVLPSTKLARAAAARERAKKLADEHVKPKIDKRKSELQAKHREHQFGFTELRRTYSVVAGDRWESTDETPDGSPVPVIMDSYEVTYRVEVLLRYKDPKRGRP